MSENVREAMFEVCFSIGYVSSVFKYVSLNFGGIFIWQRVVNCCSHIENALCGKIGQSGLLDCHQNLIILT